MISILKNKHFCVFQGSKITVFRVLFKALNLINDSCVEGLEMSNMDLRMKKEKE